MISNEEQTPWTSHLEDPAWDPPWAPPSPVTHVRSRRAGFALGAALLLLGAGRASASGYHPDFDVAVEEAPWIVLHTVAAEQTPSAALADLPAGARGRAYFVKVKRCFKGPFRPGDELVIWDPWYQSTAGYDLSTTGENLTFLAPPGAQRRLRVRTGAADLAPAWRTHETYGGKARARVRGLRVGVPIRNLGTGPAKGRNDGLAAWVRLLELTRVGTRALDLRQARAILGGAFDRVLSSYALTHWPGPLGRDDGTVVRALLARHLDDAGVSIAALALLRRSRIPLPPAELRAVLSRGAPYSRSASLKDVVASNVSGVKDVLWSWAAKDEHGALEAIEVLARLAPAYLKGQLRASRLPFWLEIPAMNAIGIRPEALGRPPYPVPIKDLKAWELHSVGRLVKGQTFDGMYPMSQRQESWAAVFPLIVPHLPRMTVEAREIAIAFMRTLRFEVKRSGQQAVLGSRTSVPLELHLEWVQGQAGKVRVTEVARRPVLLCDLAARRIALQGPAGMVRSVDGTFGAFASTAAPRSCFQWRTGVVRSEIVDASQVLSGATGAGRTSLQVAVLHARSGAEHGLDAWTGLVVSPPLALPSRSDHPRR